jgi:hypothetical protein
MVSPQQPATPTAACKAPEANSHCATVTQSSEDEIRDYAHHLYVERGAVSGHDRDDWLEAEACLRASVPKESTRTRMHHHSPISERAVLPLVKHGQ